MRFAVACAVLVACGGDANNLGDEGAFSLDWQILRNDQLIDCATGGVAEIQIVTNDGVATEERFFCEDGMATSGPRAPGVHTINVNGLDAAGGLVASSSDQALIVAGQVTALGTFPLDVDPAECDASSCALGCCDDFNNCIDPPTDDACGIGGAVCESCVGLGATCNVTEGVCVQ
jgi:hypothetical protein